MEAAGEFGQWEKHKTEPRSSCLEGVQTRQGLFVVGSMFLSS